MPSGAAATSAASWMPHSKQSGFLQVASLHGSVLGSAGASCTAASSASCFWPRASPAPASWQACPPQASQHRSQYVLPLHAAGVSGSSVTPHSVHWPSPSASSCEGWEVPDLVLATSSSNFSGSAASGKARSGTAAPSPAIA
eukprot:CAMPEP_0168462542 /NCGR_PEP_ID=MMETSP0228-20121227/54574_1 /TAXON_ID=133427 /ORGANISM="Protoceratium reticulatum, Strain CCCM 535 (=CCMP 1889)" /LENGTH=141 /DNA_ID=CAMNT_0008477931 /DNA_START=66 /DNA_END=491 /DNA_ORIENTATION=-